MGFCLAVWFSLVLFLLLVSMYSCRPRWRDWGDGGLAASLNLWRSGQRLLGKSSRFTFASAVIINSAPWQSAEALAPFLVSSGWDATDGTYTSLYVFALKLPLLPFSWYSRCVQGPCGFTVFSVVVRSV